MCVYGASFVSREPLIITLDGPSGSGKSTISHQLAKHFGVPCLDTGAMYRTVAMLCLQRKIDLDNDAEVTKVVQSLEFRFPLEDSKTSAEYREIGKAYVRLGKEIRTPEVSMAASRIARLKNVRKALVAQQQKIGAELGAVVEGRDAGTVIFPHARFKFFMTATNEERARRRYLELKDKLGDQSPPVEEVYREMVLRDEQDSKRAESPLIAALDAELIETTGLDLGQVLALLIRKIEARNGQVR
jgi:cytidylate kinase